MRGYDLYLAVVDIRTTDSLQCRPREHAVASDTLLEQVQTIQVQANLVLHGDRASLGVACTASQHLIFCTSWSDTSLLKKAQGKICGRKQPGVRDKLTWALAKQLGVASNTLKLLLNWS